MIKQVLIIRKDLNMRKGKMIAQGAHASLLSALAIQGSMTYKQWMATGMTKIALSVDSNEELHAIYDKALAAGINAILITDHGKTEFNGVPTDTAVALGPSSPDILDPLSGHLKLL